MLTKVSFRHTYQKLPLIPVEEFLALHPEHADDDENDLMVARINHERTEREALEQQRVELQKRKQKLIADNKKRRDDLANLDKDLEKFIDVSCSNSVPFVESLCERLTNPRLGRKTHPKAVREGCMRRQSFMHLPHSCVPPSVKTTTGNIDLWLIHSTCSNESYDVRATPRFTSALMPPSS